VRSFISILSKLTARRQGSTGNPRKQLRHRHMGHPIRTPASGPLDANKQPYACESLSVTAIAVSAEKQDEDVEEPYTDG
jgi:hypothetical protein